MFAQSQLRQVCCYHCKGLPRMKDSWRRAGGGVCGRSWGSRLPCRPARRGVSREVGGDRGTRTPNLGDANAALSQLSYIPAQAAFPPRDWIVAARCFNFNRARQYPRPRWERLRLLASGIGAMLNGRAAAPSRADGRPTSGGGPSHHKRVSWSVHLWKQRPPTREASSQAGGRRRFWPSPSPEW